MENFLINMAIIKVNWDESRKDILDNYLPLVGYAVKCCDGDIVALEDVESKLRDIADFKIPRGAIITMLKRATRPQYQYIEKHELKYVKVHHNLAKLNYEGLRNEQRRRFNALKTAFSSFCKQQYNVTVTAEEADNYFFDILYDIAPSLYKNLKNIESVESKEIQPQISRSYLVSSFIQYVVEHDQDSFSSLESFVRGAMLTETFYYSSPEDIPKKFRKTTIFFDTSFLIRLLGYCSEAYNRPCRELHEMLIGMGVRMKCFRKTFNEIHGILLAVSKKLQHGALIPNRPGDAFDYFTQNKYSPSDLEYEIAKLEDNLKALLISIEEHPRHQKSLTVDEIKLDNYISNYIEWQREKARYHDIDCLTSIFRLRSGRPKKYLESCEAIFVTTNSGLARASTKFFNDEYCVSDAPVCMSDQVFTTLVWLKAVKKIPDLPKDRIVANCYAALNPSEDLWQKYLKEAEKLLKQKSICEHDFAVLVNSLEARRRVMSLTLGDDDVYIEGTVEEVLKNAKSHYMREAEDKIKNTERKYSSMTRKIDDYIRFRTILVSRISYWSLLIISSLVLVLASFKTSPSDFSKLIRIFELSVKEILQGIIFIIFIILTVINIVFGLKLSGPARWLSDLISNFFVKRLKAKFFSNN